MAMTGRQQTVVGAGASFGPSGARSPAFAVALANACKPTVRDGDATFGLETRIIT